MPWLSKAQRRWGHSPAGVKALGGEEKVREWDKATKGGLRERIGKSKTEKAKERLKRGMSGKRR